MSSTTMEPLRVNGIKAAAMMACTRNTFGKRVAAGLYPPAGGDGLWSVRLLRERLDAPLSAPLERRPRAVALGPGVTHLYRHFDADGRLLYVGISLSVMARLADHKASSHWFWTIARIEVTAYASRASAIKAERVTIKREKPLHNIVHASTP